MGLDAYLKSNNKVSKEIQQERISICESCPAFNEVHRTCGKPIIGGYAYSTILQKRIRLCGCYLDEKTKFISEFCPASRW